MNAISPLRISSLSKSPEAYIVIDQAIIIRFHREYDEDTKEGRIVRKSVSDGSGLVVMGYVDGSSIEPITKLLDGIPGFEYGLLELKGSSELKDGRKLLFMCKSEIVEHLSAERGFNIRPMKGCFDMPLILTLPPSSQTRARDLNSDLELFGCVRA